MYHDFTYEATLASSLRAQWQLDDVLPPDKDLDFSRNFLPEVLARTSQLPSLSRDEQRTLNQIVAHQYLYLFGAVEEFILPFVLDHARPMLNEDDYRIRALLNFASEEAKHIHLFKRYHEAFVRGFPVECEVVGPREALPQWVLARHPLAVGLAILMIEWMTQGHYLGAARDDSDMDPLFKSLLKHHWMEEAQHAKLDTLIVDALAERCSEAEIDGAIEEYFAILRYFDECLKAQAALNIRALERASGRKVRFPKRLLNQQWAAARWVYFGSGMIHRQFRATLRSVSPKGDARVAAAVEAMRRPMQAMAVGQAMETHA